MIKQAQYYKSKEYPPYLNMQLTIARRNNFGCFVKAWPHWAMSAWVGCYRRNVTAPTLLVPSVKVVQIWGFSQEKQGSSSLMSGCGATEMTCSHLLLPDSMSFEQSWGPLLFNPMHPVSPRGGELTEERRQFRLNVAGSLLFLLVSTFVAMQMWSALAEKTKQKHMESRLKASLSALD